MARSGHRAWALLVGALSSACSHDWDFYERVEDGTGASAAGGSASGGIGGASSGSAGSGTTGGGGSGGGPGIVTVDASSSEQSGIGFVDSLAFPHAVAGDDRLLWVGVSLRDETGVVVDGVTFGGTPLEPAGSASVAGELRVEAWYLIAPEEGPHDVVISPSASVRLVAGAVSFNGVDPRVPFGDVFSADGSGVQAIVDVDDVPSGGLVVDSMARPLKSGSTEAGPGQEEQWNLATAAGGDADNVTGAGSTKAARGSTTSSWNFGSAQPWVLVAAALRPR